MKMDCYDELYRLETRPEALSATADYLAGKLDVFLQKQEPVLICFPNSGTESLGAVFGEAVCRCGGKPIYWGPDYRWKELLRIAFDTHTQTVAAPPMVILGLMKLAKATATPLYIHNVVLGGYPYARWMVEGLKKGLDSKIWGCYSIRSGPVVVGFTCDQEAGIHIREDLFDAVVMDQEGSILPDPQRGALKLIYKKEQDLIYDPEESAILRHQPCSCGNDAVRIVETIYTGRDNPSKTMLEQRFLAWSSVLDYRARQTESGIALELVVFPGESLPKLPSCAKLTIRSWDPEQDIPFYIQDNFIKIPEKYW